MRIERKGVIKINYECFLLVICDIAWWNDNALLVNCRGGLVTVCGPLLTPHVETQNLFGRAPEKFLPNTQISSVNCGK
jgi:hypothetical protein